MFLFSWFFIQLVMFKVDSVEKLVGGQVIVGAVDNEVNL